MSRRRRRAKADQVVSPKREDPAPQAPPPATDLPRQSHSPLNWKLQGPGMGLEVIGGAAVAIWPERRWIAGLFFSVGTVLILWPLLAWSLLTIAKRMGLRSPLDFDDPMRRTVSNVQLAMATVALAGMIGALFFALAKVQEADLAAKQRQQQDELLSRTKQQRIADIETVVSDLAYRIKIGDQLEAQRPKSDSELYNWLLSVGRWQGRTYRTYERAIELSVLTDVDKEEFDKVQAAGLAGSFNNIHGDQRGYMLARVSVMRSHVRRLETELSRLKA